jgi:hypothetical protein
MVHFLCIE